MAREAYICVRQAEKAQKNRDKSTVRTIALDVIYHILHLNARDGQVRQHLAAYRKHCPIHRNSWWKEKIDQADNHEKTGERVRDVMP